MKSISILGSTGSIGMQALEVIKENPNKLQVVGLACNSNIQLLKQQIKEFKPKAVAVFDKEQADALKGQVDVQVFSGMEGLVNLSKLEEADTVLNSLVGSIGVKPTVEAIKSKKHIALANKETLVTAGDIVMNLVKKHTVELKPIDSEHSAIFQCLQGSKRSELKSITITCSGGPFRNKTKQELEQVTPEEALKHPKWNMGAKITIDSATLMNKGFEVIEVKMLFDIDYSDIFVVVHPESIIHSLVEFQDSSVLAQLGLPDMKLPIQYALSHPDRWKNTLSQLDLIKSGQLNFLQPDISRFPCLKYAYEAGRIGGSMPCVLNAANEIAVNAFLTKKIKFMDIPRLITKQMDRHNVIKNPELDEILGIDKKVKEELTTSILEN